MDNNEIIKKIMRIKYTYKDKSMVVLATHDIIEQLEKDGFASYKREMIYGYHWTICGLPSREIRGTNYIFVAYDLRFYERIDKK